MKKNKINRDSEPCLHMSDDDRRWWKESNIEKVLRKKTASEN